MLVLVRGCLLGGEGSGLSTALRALCDALLTIPPRRDLNPGVESLNVSVATGTEPGLEPKCAEMHF